MINSVILVGNLSQDPELRFFPDGTPICTFTLACNRSFNSDQVDWLDCEVTGGQAEPCHKYLQKGSMVGVRGYIRVDKRKRSDGTTRKYFKIRAEHVKFLLTRRDGYDAPADDGPPEDWEEPENDDSMLDLPF